MKTKGLFLFALFCVTQITAQSNFTTIIESEIVKDEITFSIIGDDLYLSIDNSVTPKKMLKSISLQGKSNQIVFTSDFINPLKYQLSLNNKVVDDELTKAAESYLSVFSKYKASIPKNSSGANKRVHKSATKTKEYNIINPHLIELTILLNSSNFEGKFQLSSNTDFLEAMEGLNDVESQNTILEFYEKIFINIYNINSYDSIDTTLKLNKTHLDSIAEKIKGIAKSHKNLSNIVSTLTNPLLASTATSIEKNIANLIDSKTNDVIKDHAAFLKNKEELDTKYTAFKKLLDNIKSRTFKKTKETIIDNVVFEKGKRNEVTIYLKSFEYDKKKKSLKEKEQKSFLINLRKFRTFIPVVSSGVLYTNLTFNTYGTETNDMGETTLAQGKDKDNEVAVGAYLNLYLNNGWDSPMFLQFGVGPSKEKPLLFAGFGMNIASRINLSGGAVFTWSPELDALNVGDIITGSTAIEDDIVYKFTSKPKFYLGISFNLTK